MLRAQPTCHSPTLPGTVASPSADAQSADCAPANAHHSFASTNMLEHRGDTAVDHAMPHRYNSGDTLQQNSPDETKNGVSPQLTTPSGWRIGANVCPRQSASVGGDTANGGMASEHRE